VEGDGGEGSGGDSDGSDGDETGGNGDETATESVPLVACDGAIAEDASTTKVKWYFTVESSSEDPSNVADKVCGAMSTAVIGYFDNECATRRRLKGRRLDIQGYSPEVTCTYSSTCVPTDASSESCAVYEAEVDVAYDGEGDNSSAGEVTTTVTTVAEDTLSGDNADGLETTVAEELDDGNEALTFVGYGIPEVKDKVGAGLSGESFADDSNQGLTRAEKMAIAFMSVLLFLLLLLCFVCCRRNRNRDWDSKSVDTGDTQLSPTRGAGGGIGGSRGSRGGSSKGGSKCSLSDLGDDMTYMTSDFNNLALHHSKLDVHKCSSASCDQCNPIIRNDTNGVFFINSKSGAPLSDILEEEYKSPSEYKSEMSAPPPPVRADKIDAEIPPPPAEEPPAQKKSFFSRFRRNKAPRNEEPAIRAHGQEDGDEIEIEI